MTTRFFIFLVALATVPSTTVAASQADAGPETAALSKTAIREAEQLSSRGQAGELRPQSKGYDGEPPWATAQFAAIDRRLERLTRFQERAIARTETPAPRLNEPMVLLTVAICTAILGFLAGRIVGRRSIHDRRRRL